MRRPAGTLKALVVAGATAAVVAGSAGAAAAVVAPTSPAAPVNTSRPTVKGTLVQGAVLTAVTGSWTGTPPPQYSYRWLRCQTSCVAIPGATGRTYRLTAADVSRRMQVIVTAANLLGSTSAGSARTGLVRSAFRDPGATEKPPSGKARRLRSRIVIKGRLVDAGASFTSVAVRASRGARVAVRCRGKGCPYGRASRKLRVKRIRLHSLERSLPAGVVLELRVTKRGLIGRYTRVRIRRGRVPRRIDRCLKPGARKPSRCR